MNRRPKKVELQNTVTGLKQQLSELQDGNTDNNNLYDENGMSHCSPVPSLPDDSEHQDLIFNVNLQKL